MVIASVISEWTRSQRDGGCTCGDRIVVRGRAVDCRCRGRTRALQAQVDDYRDRSDRAQFVLKQLAERTSELHALATQGLDQ
jgi:hypothetical protein